MARKNYHYCKTELPDGCGAKILWRPSFVFYEADWSTKGYALFTSHENADGYRLLLEPQQSYPVSVALLDDIPGYAAAAVEHIRSANKAYKNTVVYIDPSSLFCKSTPPIKPDYGSLEKFLFKNFQNEIPWAHDVVGITHEHGFTIELLQDRTNQKFIAICMKGTFDSREDLSYAIEDAMGTTDEVYTKRSEACDLPEDALKVVAEHIERLHTK